MPTTPYMSLLLPTVSVTLGPTYASENNTAFTTVDSHDHTSGKGVAVPSGGLNIDADLPFNSFNSTLLRSSRYDPQSGALALVTDIGCLYVAGVDLWFNDVDGNQIQLTASGALNAASIGGIGGDYATSSASVAYSAATKTFTFLQDTNKSSLLDTGTILLRRVDNTSSAAITIKASTSLSAGWTLTLPTAAPASTMFVAIDSSGNLSFTNSLVTLALSGALTVGATLDVTGNTTLGGTLGVTGAASFNGAVTLGDAAADAITVTGTLSSNLLPTDATYTLGSSTKNFVSLALNNGATDAGAVYFDGGTTKFLKANAAGTILELGGFATLRPNSNGGADLGDTTDRFGVLRLNTNIGNSSTPDSNALYADLIPKAWAWSPSGGLTGRVNVNLPNSGYSHSGTGQYDYTLSTGFSSNYAIQVTTEGGSGNPLTTDTVLFGGTTFRVLIKRSDTGAATDSNHSVTVFGRQ